jgi:hypothetical protein
MSPRGFEALRNNQFAVCVDNSGYEASLELNKIYVVLADRELVDGELRVVDESGDDYVFRADRFVPIKVPARVRASILKTLPSGTSRRSRANRFSAPSM